MLMDLEKLFDKYQLQIIGVLHIGAHEAEEYELYEHLGVSRTVWIEANPVLAKRLKERFAGDPTQEVLHEAISDGTCDRDLYIANNGQSSSLLRLGTHQQHHPQVEYIDTVTLRTRTLDQLIRDHNNHSGLAGLNFWNLDIQGMELAALKGATAAINMADYIYTEVNRESVYQGCALIEEIDEFLDGHHFERVETVWTPFAWGDAFYVRSNLL